MITILKQSLEVRDFAVAETPLTGSLKADRAEKCLTNA